MGKGGRKVKLTFYLENHDKLPLLREILKNKIFKQINNYLKIIPK